MLAEKFSGSNMFHAKNRRKWKSHQKNGDGNGSDIIHYEGADVVVDFGKGIFILFLFIFYFY